MIDDVRVKELEDKIEDQLEGLLELMKEQMKLKGNDYYFPQRLETIMLTYSVLSHFGPQFAVNEMCNRLLNHKLPPQKEEDLIRELENQGYTIYKEE